MFVKERLQYDYTFQYADCQSQYIDYSYSVSTITGQPQKPSGLRHGLRILLYCDTIFLYADYQF